MRGLRLPKVLSVAVLVVGAACADDDGGPRADASAADAAVADVAEELYFCIPEDYDGGSGVPTADANPCGQTVAFPDDCPDGCRPVG